MSRFFSPKFSRLVPYVPGEQPKDVKYVKLNTNESPFPPAPGVEEAARTAAATLALYSDPDSTALISKLAGVYGVKPRQLIAVNGSDEVLNFAFAAFCDEHRPAVFADITYGFYKVFAAYNRVPYAQVPLREDFTLDVEAMKGAKGTLFIANPNAPTGIALPLREIEGIVASDPDRVVVVDEAYIDFGGESALPLLAKYDNLLVTRTFSKSRSLAGGRLGFGIGSAALIADLHTVRYSTNPYNVNSMTAAAGIAALEAEEYTKENCRTVAENRAWAAGELKALGFEMTPSAANFLFARHMALSGKALYEGLKARGVLVRHFDLPRIADYNRITVGSRKQMEILVEKVREILES